MKSIAHTIICLIVVGTLLACGFFVESCSHRQHKITAAKESFLLGNQAYEQDSLEVCFNHFLRARTLALDAGDDSTTFQASVYLAMIYEMMGHPDSAYNILKRTPYMEHHDSKHYSSQYYLRMLSLYALKIDQDYDASLDYNAQVLDLSRRLYPQDSVFVYTDLANRAELMWRKGDNDQAWEIINYLESLPPLKFRLYLAQTYLVHGALLMDQGDFAGAYHYLEKAERESRAINLHENEVEALELMARIDSLREDFVNYVAHDTRRHQVIDLLRGSETTYQLAIMQEQNKLDVEKQAHERQKLVFWFGVAILLFAILILLVIMYFMGRTAATRQRLAQLEKEQLDAQLEKHRLEKELLDLRMLQSQAELERAHKDILALSLQIAEMPEGEKRNQHLQAFEKRLREIDNAFFRKLEAAYPTLTDNDMRLLGMLKLGMSSHEILALLSITADSLKKSKYRLRKKLGMNPETSFQDFIQNVALTPEK
ncbi:MAG: hypothetical protein LIP03_11115 [Bacteroidales bacterium]|nr:hypothetical protein [Bacteroidales bacterium]